MRARAFARTSGLCVDCTAEGVVGFAEEVDHEDGDRTNDHPSNHAPVCKEHHRKRTSARAGTRPLGCDVSGRPTDVRHPWNNKR